MTVIMYAMVRSWTNGGLRAAAHQLLEGNWVEGTTADGRRYAYTRPASRYPEQFFWDSCFHAVAWSRIDPARARAELRTLLRAQRPCGLIGHTVFWPGRVRPSRRLGYNVLAGRDASTWTIQPPLLAWAWAEVADRSPDDPGFRTEGLEAILAYHRWLERERGGVDGLIGILQPDESGLDATPAYDVLGWRAHPLPGFLLLLGFNRRRRFDYRRVVAEGGFHAIDVLVNTAWALSWSALGRLGHAEGPKRGAAITQALVRRLWDPKRGIFFPEGPQGRPLRVSTWAGLAPLALEHLPEDVGRQMVEEQLLDPARYWLPYPVPSTSAAEPAFRPSRSGPRLAPRYWRGPTWLFSTVFPLAGLVRLGFHDRARELAERTAGMVERSGFREYYNPFSGEGLGAHRFATSAMALDFVERLRV